MLHTRNGNVVIEYSLIKRFLELLERQFCQERKYESRYGKKTVDGLKSVSEIAIAKITVQNLAEFCTGKRHDFEILKREIQHMILLYLEMKK